MHHRTRILCLIFLLFCQSLTLSAQDRIDVDVCIYGGTSAGVIAAYTAKKYGKNVVLIEPGRHLGGLSSGGLGYTDIGNKFAVTGLARDFYRRIGTHYGKFEQWIFEPHVAEQTFQQYISEASVPVLYGYRLAKVDRNASAITEIVVENSDQPSSSTNKIVSAKIFIDCSYEGDLMAKAGVSYIVGREANSKYGETYNGVQMRDKHQFPDGIDPYKVPGKPESGLLWGIADESLQPQGTGDKKVQAYNFRICLTRDPKNMIPITMPDNYDSSRYELLIRVLQKQPDRPFNQILKPDLMPNEKTDINNNGPFSTDMIGMNYAYPDASYSERKRITRMHEDYTKGLLYFIGHSQRIPGHIRNEILKWGYPKDEYKDNNNWSPQMYVREARRMLGEYVMTQANCEAKEVVKDRIGMAAYTMDSHNTSRVVVNGMVKNEGDVQVGGFSPYPISYRSLVPKAAECTNLLVPVCLSATHIAYGSIRMEPVFMVLSQSAAVAAVQAIDKKLKVQDVDVGAVQEYLKDDPLADQSTPEILIDNEDSSFVFTSGAWIKNNDSHAGYGSSYLKLENGKGSVTFTPSFKTTGAYKVLAYFPRIEGSAKTVTVTVHSADGTKTMAVGVATEKVEGQTSGEWVSLGTHRFNKDSKQSIAIAAPAQTGIVIADAVLFVPERKRK